jgi:hypothetical protein
MVTKRSFNPFQAYSHYEWPNIFAERGALAQVPELYGMDALEGD